MIKEETSVKNVYLDVSHNLSAFEAVIESINLKHPGCSITIVCGFSKMKDINSMLEYMLKFTNKIHFVV
jgi:folylpolyglutamate synthase/dihydropteroate synthase